MSEETEQREAEPRENVRIRLVGGPAHEFEFSMPEPPPFIGYGHPVVRYDLVPSDGAVLTYRCIEQP